jgi:hypothetical protein
VVSFAGVLDFTRNGRASARTFRQTTHSNVAPASPPSRAWIQLPRLLLHAHLQEKATLPTAHSPTATHAWRPFVTHTRGENHAANANGSLDYAHACVETTHARSVSRGRMHVAAPAPAGVTTRNVALHDGLLLS